jgi:hypothetical protein
MALYDELVTLLRERALEGEELGWKVDIDYDLLTHIRAATKDPFNTAAEAWTAANDLAERVAALGVKLVHRNAIGVENTGWTTEDSAVEHWYGTVNLRVTGFRTA